MSICLSCLKSTTNNDLYHKSCLKKLFGVEILPSLNLKSEDINSQVIKFSSKMSISGVQPKLSLKLNKKDNLLEVTALGGEYILKPQTQTFKNLPENEQLCMTLAQNVNIDVPPHALIKLSDGQYAYIVKRFDRDKGNKIHQEDFQQILGISTIDKYKGSYEKIGKTIHNISAYPGLDVQLFYERVLFCFIIGNGDAHTKNFSMQYLNNGDCRLSPAYDMVSSRLVIPDEDFEMALPLNAKQNRIKASDFINLSNYLNIPTKAPINEIISYLSQFVDTVNDYDIFSKEDRDKLIEIMTKRHNGMLS